MATLVFLDTYFNKNECNRLKCCLPGICWHRFAPLGIVLDICISLLDVLPKERGHFVAPQFLKYVSRFRNSGLESLCHLILNFVSVC